jgi:hypothetical protein
MWAWRDEGVDVEIGAVADWCNRCDRVPVFSIEEKMVQLDFLGIPYGKMHRRGRRRICWRCDEWHFVPFPSRYAELVPVELAERMRWRESTRVTNPDRYFKLEEDREHNR